MPGRKLQQPKKKSPKLIRLEEQLSALEKEKEEEITRLNSEERSRDTRRKILAGQAVLKEASRRETFRKFLYNLLDNDLRKQYDRDIFDDLMQEWGMPPLPRLAPSPGTALTQGGEGNTEAKAATSPAEAPVDRELETQ